MDKKYLPWIVVGLLVALILVVAVTVRQSGQSPAQQGSATTPPEELTGGIGEGEVPPPPGSFDLPPAGEGEEANLPTEQPPEDSAPALDPASGELPPPPLPTEQAPEPGAAAPAASSAVVSYNGSGYTSAVVEINRGESVTFVNKSSREMWPASAVHPTHAAYPKTGGCIGSTFDACRALGNGESWNFTFDEAGRWNYHDHLNPSARGTVVVK